MVLAYDDRYHKYEPVTSTDTFDVPFPLFDAADLSVFVDGVEDTTYSVSGNFNGGVADDAQITLTSPVTGVDVEIYGDRKPRREQNYGGASPDLAENLQRDADQITAVQQEQERKFENTIRVSPSHPAPDPLDADEAARAGRAIIFSDDGTKMVVGPDAGDIASAQANAEVATTKAAEASADADRAELAADSSLIMSGNKKYLELMTDLIYPDTATDSTAGIAAALAEIGADGGGTLIFPREASFTGRIEDIPANVVLDVNGSKLTPVDDLEECIQVLGAQSATKFGLQTGASMWDDRIQVSNYVSGGGAVGDLIWIYDDSARLSDSAVDINNNIRQVVAIDAGSPDVVYLDFPLSFKKDAVGTDRMNIAILSPKTGVKIFNARTEPSGTSTHGTGIAAIFCRDLEVHNHEHLQGAGAPARNFQACVDVRASNLRTPGVRDPLTYGLLLNQGSRDAFVDGVEDDGTRHAVDMDSVDLCKVINAVSRNSGSTPFGMAHNGVGGFGNFIEGVAYNAPDSADGYVFNTRGFMAVTGQKSSEIGYPILSPRVRIKAYQRNDKGTSINTGALIQQPMHNADMEFTLINGDGTHDTNNSIGFRFFPNGNVGSRVRLPKARGYKFSVSCDNEANGTAINKGLRIELPDIDYFDTAIYSVGADGFDIPVIGAGPNQNAELFHFDQPSGRYLRELNIGHVTMEVASAASKMISLTGVAALGYTHGSIQSILTLDNAIILSKGADFTLSLADILTHGSKAIRIDGTAACRITTIEPGLVIGQRVSIWSATSGTFPITIETGCVNFRADATKTLTLELLCLEWDGAYWYPVGA